MGIIKSNTQSIHTKSLCPRKTTSFKKIVSIARIVGNPPAYWSEYRNPSNPISYKLNDMQYKKTLIEDWKEEKSMVEEFWTISHEDMPLCETEEEKEKSLSETEKEEEMPLCETEEETLDKKILRQTKQNVEDIIRLCEKTNKTLCLIWKKIADMNALLAYKRIVCAHIDVLEASDLTRTTYPTYRKEINKKTMDEIKPAKATIMKRDAWAYAVFFHKFREQIRDMMKTCNDIDYEFF